MHARLHRLRPALAVVLASLVIFSVPVAVFLVPLTDEAVVSILLLCAVGIGWIAGGLLVDLAEVLWDRFR